MKYKDLASPWRDTRDEAIDLAPLTPEYADACLEYRELREKQLQRKLAQLRLNENDSQRQRAEEG